MKRLCIFSGSNFGNHPDYEQATRHLAQTLCQNDIEVVYGGAHVGLMGVLAEETLKHGGRIIGVIPEYLKNLEVAHPNLTDLRVVNSMHERKALMEELSDGFIALPGGIGTLEELFEIFTWAQLGLHKKPFGLLNTRGFYDKLASFLSHMVEEKFLRPENAAMIQISDSTDEMLALFENYSPPQVKKWINKNSA